MKYNVNFKIWIENNEGKSLFGDGKWELLCAIDETGSLKEAVEKMKWGYRATWNKLQTIEKRLGFKIIERRRGGSGGGGQTMLTDQGKRFVEIFRQIHVESDKEFMKMSQKFNELMEPLNPKL